MTSESASASGPTASSRSSDADAAVLADLRRLSTSGETEPSPVRTPPSSSSGGGSGGRASSASSAALSASPHCRSSM